MRLTRSMGGVLHSMKKEIKKSDLENWRRIYTEEFDKYDAFTTKLFDLLEELIKKKRIDFSQIEKRTKTINSFVEKLKRKPYQYDNPLKDITDLSGIRIITYYKEDTSNISTLIEDQFMIDLENSINKSQIIDIDKFGYRSIHYVVSLSKKRATLPEWETFENLKAEIQVRTVLQHAWASISHKLSYKTTSEAPKESRRKLSRLSALLELADDEFTNLKDSSKKIEKRYEKDFGESKFEKTEINLDSLEAYFKKSEEHVRWKKLGIGTGIKIVDELNKSFIESRLRVLLDTLITSEIHEIKDLHFLLRSFDKNNLKFIKNSINRLGKKDEDVSIPPISLITFIVLFSRRELIEEKKLVFERLPIKIIDYILEGFKI